MNRERDDGYDGKYAWVDMKDVMGANEQTEKKTHFNLMKMNIIYICTCIYAKSDEQVRIHCFWTAYKLKFGL